MSEIKHITNTSDIAKCYETYKELRPHLTSADELVQRICAQFNENFTLIAIKQDENIVACCGFREMNTLAWGKIIYIDDLATHSQFRKNGYASQLLDYVIQFAKEHDFQQVHLDTGFQRYAAHKVYLNKGFIIDCHHMQLKFI